MTGTPSSSEDPARAIDQACSPSVDYTSRRLVAAARAGGADAPVRIHSLAESIRFIDSDDQRGAVTQRVMELVAPNEASQLRESLRSADPFAGYRDGANMTTRPAWEGIRASVSVNAGAGGVEVQRDILSGGIGNPSYPRDAEIDTGTRTAVEGGGFSASRSAASGECGVSAPVGIPGLSAAVTGGPGSDPLVRDRQYSVGVEAAIGPLAAGVNMGIRTDTSPGMEGRWIQTNALGEATRAGDASVSRQAGPHGQTVSGTSIDRDGRATTYSTAVDPRQLAESRVNPAWSDGRTARPPTPPGPRDEEPGFFGRVGDGITAMALGRNFVDEERRNARETRNNQFLQSELSPTDRALFSRIRSQMPSQTPSETVAHATLLAREGGIRNATDLRETIRDGNNFWLVGSYPGARASIDLTAAPPPIGETVQRLQAYAPDPVIQQGPLQHTR